MQKTLETGMLITRRLALTRKGDVEHLVDIVCYGWVGYIRNARAHAEQLHLSGPL